MILAPFLFKYIDFMSTGEKKKKIQKAVISPVFAITTIIVFMVKYMKAISHFALIHWVPSKKKKKNQMFWAKPPPVNKGSLASSTQCHPSVVEKV